MHCFRCGTDWPWPYHWHGGYPLATGLIGAIGFGPPPPARPLAPWWLNGNDGHTLIWDNELYVMLCRQCEAWLVDAEKAIADAAIAAGEAATSQAAAFARIAADAAAAQAAADAAAAAAQAQRFTSVIAAAAAAEKRKRKE